MAYSPRYTSVTLLPPPNWSVGVLNIENQTVSANGSGQYVIAPCSNACLSSLLSQGWVIAAVTP